MQKTDAYQVGFSGARQASIVLAHTTLPVEPGAGSATPLASQGSGALAALTALSCYFFPAVVAASRHRGQRGRRSVHWRSFDHERSIRVLASAKAHRVKRGVEREHEHER
jgi:hypothetical protein